MSFIWLSIFLLLSPFIILFFHALLIRLFSFFKKDTSQFKIALCSVISTNIPVLVISLLILNFDFKNIFSYIYVLLTFNLLGFFYFLFFNLSESGIRIKTILLIRKKRTLRTKELKEYYSKNSTEMRLQRLIILGQIEKAGSDSYILKKKLLFFISKVLVFFRFLLGFNNSINDKYL